MMEISQKDRWEIKNLNIILKIIQKILIVLSIVLSKKTKREMSYSFLNSIDEFKQWIDYNLERSDVENINLCSTEFYVR